MRRRTEQEIINTIVSEVKGIIQEFGYDERIIAESLNKRYNPNTVAKALALVK